MDDGQVAASTARYEKKKEAILAAATAVLNRQGVKGMTLADVGARVGLLTTSVTYYFKKKEDLAAACLLRGVATYDALVDEAAEAVAPESRLKTFLERFLELSRRIRLGEAPPIPSFTEVRALKAPHYETVSEAFNDLFRKVRGLFDVPQFEALSRLERTARTHLLLEQTFWTATWLRRYDVEDYPRVGERMYDILVGGLSAGGGWAPAKLSAFTRQACDGEAVNREAFLVAATRLINQRGYRGASVEEISAQMGVTKGSFYHHNEDKDGLVRDCFARTFEVMRQAQFAGREAGPSQWDRLTAATAALVAFQLSDHGPLLRASALWALPLELRQEMADQYARISERFAAMVSDGIAEGSIRPVDPLIAAHMLNSMLNAAASLRAWAPGIEAVDAATLFARPLMTGVFKG
jgi:AcrR family transcriptional regulator